MSFKCEFCNKDYKNISNLNNHQKTAQFCIKIQNGNSNINSNFNCEFCNKKLSSKFRLNSHKLICKESKKQKDEDIKEKNNLIIELKSKLEMSEKLQNSLTDVEKKFIRKDSILSLNSIPIISRKEDGYINLTALCKAGKKDFKEWNRNKKTQAFLKVLISTVGIPTVEIIKCESGGNGERHTWGHPQVAVNIAQWISPEFDVHVSKWIFDLKEKNNELIDELYSLKILEQPKLIQDTIFKLKLINNEVLDIAIRKDGYINATQLCKAGNKLFGHYQTSKQTQDYLQVLSSNIGIPIMKLLDSKVGGSHSGTYVHRKVAYHLAQWISPQFAVQVSNVLDELFLTGKVELKNEKTTIELDNIYEEKRLSLDIQPYLAKDIVYFFEFTPCEKDLDDPELLKDKNIHFFEFGVTSNIQQRQSSYGPCYRLDKGFIYKTGYLASLGESYVKKIVNDLNLKLVYKNKIECMRCSYEELEEIYNLMTKHSSFVKEEPTYETINDSNLEIYRIELELKYKLENYKLEIQAKQEYDKLEIQAKQEYDKRQDIIALFKENILSFEQFQKCLSVFK